MVRVMNNNTLSGVFVETISLLNDFSMIASGTGWRRLVNFFCN